MAVALVQTTKLLGGNGNNGAATFNAAVTPGNLVVVSLFYVSSPITGVTVTDSKGNAYTQSDYLTHSGEWSIYVFYLLNCPNNPISVTDVSGQAWGIIVDEFSGVAATDGHSNNFQDFGSTTTVPDMVTSGSITTTANGDLIYGTTWGSYIVNIGHGTGFTIAYNASQYGITEWRVQTTAGPVAATFTYTGSTGQNYTAGLAFKVSAGGGSTVDLAGSFVV